MQKPLPFPDDHPTNLRRVSGRIANLVIEFVNARVGETWHAGDLHRFVAERAQISPASADRVLRDLRQRKQINYAVVSRRYGAPMCPKCGNLATIVKVSGEVPK